MRLSTGVCRKSSVLPVIFMLLFYPLQPSVAAPFGEARVEIAGKVIKVEVAATEAQRIKGLSSRAETSKKYFMLFVFDTPQQVIFWMKDTNRDLSIAFVDKKNIITQIVNLKARSLKTVESKSKQIKYALEVPKGYFATSKIRIGDKLVLID